MLNDFDCNEGFDKWGREVGQMSRNFIFLHVILFQHRKRMKCKEIMREVENDYHLECLTPLPKWLLVCKD